MKDYNGLNQHQFSIKSVRRCSRDVFVFMFCNIFVKKKKKKKKLCGFSSERFPLPLGAWGGLRYFIVALPVPSI